MLSVWNDTEYQWMHALLRLEHPDQPQSKTAHIFAVHLSSMQLMQAATTIVNELIDEPVKTFLREAIEHLDLLREYRNYYVHGFQAVGWRASGEPIGFLITLAARGRLAQHDLWFNEAELDKLIEHLDALRLVFGQASNVLASKIDPMTGQRYELPTLPTRPARLSKPKRLLLGPEDKRDIGDPM